MLKVAFKINSALEGEMFYRKRKAEWIRLADLRELFVILNREIMVCLLKDVFLLSSTLLYLNTETTYIAQSFWAQVSHSFTQSDNTLLY